MRARSANFVAGQADKIPGRSVVADVQICLQGAVLPIGRESATDTVCVGPDNLAVMSRHERKPSNAIATIIDRQIIT